MEAAADQAEIDRICDEAISHGFASVCVNGRFVARVAAQLAGGPVKTCAVVGFPLGANSTAIKCAEAVRACTDGADEIDFVAALPTLASRRVEDAIQEWTPIVESARNANELIVVKVIIESAALISGVEDVEAEARISAACEAARFSGCDFVKTSTGFHPAGGASICAVRWMCFHGAGMRVKASGGIRTVQDAANMIEAGADRIGCSASVSIMGQLGRMP